METGSNPHCLDLRYVFVPLRLFLVFLLHKEPQHCCAQAEAWKPVHADERVTTKVM